MPPFAPLFRSCSLTAARWVFWGIRPPLFVTIIAGTRSTTRTSTGKCLGNGHVSGCPFLRGNLTAAMLRLGWRRLSQAEAQEQRHEHQRDDRRDEQAAE
jgi:hypothetical protein